MNSFSNLLRKLLPGIWFGLLAAIAFVVMPAAFAALDHAVAGVLARWIFSVEAPISIVFGLLVIMAERRVDLHRQAAAPTVDERADDGTVARDAHPSLPKGKAPEEATRAIPVELMLAAGALFCTVAGYYGLLPAMEAARAGGTASANFGYLHGLSTAFFGLKGLLVLALAWRATR